MKINQTVMIVTGVIILTVFFILRPKSANLETENNQGAISTLEQNSSSVAQLNNEVKSFELAVKNYKLVSGPEVIQVKEGDDVVIKITSDKADEFHLHGYDKSVDLETSLSSELKFSANLTGRFPYELEKSKQEIGALEVLPK